MTLKLEQEDERTTVCECCGKTTRSVLGWVHENDNITRCAYIARWSPDADRHPPHLTLSYGAWGEGTTADHRASIYAELKRGKWRLVDDPAPGAPPDEPETLGWPVRAKDVKRDPQRDDVLETLEFIVRTDSRLPA